MMLRETNQEQMTSEVFCVCGFEEINTFEDFVVKFRIKRGSKSNFQLPLTKNTMNCEV